MKNLQIGAKVKVTMTMIGKEDWVFESEVMDDGGRTEGVWVDHPECRGEDMLFINLSNPNVNSVEAITVQDTIGVDTDKDLKEIKKDLFKAIRNLDDVTIMVKVYDCFENTRSFDGSNDQTYDVEINYYVDGEYQDGFYNQTFVGRFRDDEVAEKMAIKRAKAVLKTVKDWFDGSDVTVEDGIEVYHA